MTIKKYRQYFINSLEDLYSIEELQSIFYLLAEKLLHLSRIDIALQLDDTLTSDEEINFNKAIDRLKIYEPVQYILGETEFFGYPFLVNKQVLIPRPETEELVSWIIEDVDKKETTILDIGTGSGCIAISLAKKLNNAVVSAIDISNKAIEVAKKNALINNVNVEYSSVDVLNFEDKLVLQDKWKSKFDIIVSNPPYVRMQEKKLMQLNVIDHEPDIALFVEDDDPLLFYKRISELSRQYLKHNGTLYLEINEYLGVEMEKMLNEAGFKHVELKKDMFGKNRMIKCW
ncbi:peptide chain release factor N(5)-glutamine methyltransferase [Flavobacteriaceae bacterium]|nr:peptide chain release factor N(5)-glutamine methyltransferase [Flavobacteriaceae bacterium]